jgi:hypothetical protein
LSWAREPRRCSSPSAGCYKRTSRRTQRVYCHPQISLHGHYHCSYHRLGNRHLRPSPPQADTTSRPQFLATCAPITSQWKGKCSGTPPRWLLCCSGMFLELMYSNACILTSKATSGPSRRRSSTCSGVCLPRTTSPTQTSAIPLHQARQPPAHIWAPLHRISQVISVVFQKTIVHISQPACLM